MDEIPSSEFEGRDFDARELIQRYRKRLPLSQLQKGLRAHHTATRQELIELINEKYADFVSLSSRMQGVERALRPLRAPLEESGELTGGLQTKLGSLLGQAEEAHQSLSKLRSRRSALNIYIENAKLFEKAKASAGERWGNPQESDGFLREHVAHENVARDLRRIRVNLGGSCQAGESSRSEQTSSPECAALLAEAQSFEESFAEGLHKRLRSLVAMAAGRPWSGQPTGEAPSGPPPRHEVLATAHLCRALTTLGRSEMVERVFAEVFAGSALRSATDACTAVDDAAIAAQGGPEGSGGAGTLDLRLFFTQVSDDLFAENAPLWWYAQRLRGEGREGEGEAEGATLAVPSLRLISNAAVVPVLQHVQQTWPNVFMPAFPDVFAANYGHASSFVARAEALMMPTEQRAFCQCAALSDFQRRWKTQVYSSLRAKEAAQRLEATAARASLLDGAVERRPPVVGHSFWLEISSEVLQLLQTIWGGRWYLDVLYPKTMQLTLELLARYGQVIRRVAVPAAQVDDKAVGLGWDAAASPPCWSSVSGPARLPRLAADVLRMIDALRSTESGHETGSITGLVMAMAPGGPRGRPAELAQQLLEQTAASLRPILLELEEAMLLQVGAAAAPQFSAIRSIPGLYRMLNKPVPSKPSQYVDAAMRPIVAFHELALQMTSEQDTIAWIRQAVDAAAGEFAGQAVQLLEATQQQDASLRRLAGRTAGAEAQVSDLEKIHIQLCLDVDSFCAAAAGLKVPGDALGLERLHAAVAPARIAFESHRAPA